MNTLLAYDFEEKTNSSIEFIFLDVLDHADNYLSKSLHAVFNNFLKADILDISVEDIKSFKGKELESYHRSIKRLNSFFEKLHNKYESVNYFEDLELKKQFRAISKKLNTLEITSFKYLMKDDHIEETPDYVKTGLAKLSMESIAKKLA